MLLNDFTGKAVLITGGTKGIGLAIGLAFGKQGAQVYLTHKWGSANEGDIIKAFTDAGAPAPVILEADVAEKDDTRALLARIKQDHDQIEVFVSNVSFAQLTDDVETYRKRSFMKSLEYSAWPFMGYAQEIHKAFGSYPRYILGTSSDGPETYYPNYDFVAASKVVMETFCKYMAKHLFLDGVKVNILRSRPVSTESLKATFGEDFEPFTRKYFGDEFFVELEEVGEAALAICSGLLDAMTGQILQLDKGVTLDDNLMRLYEQREEFGLLDF